jgi:HEAT repeat protein
MGLLRWEKAVNDLAQLSSDERPEVRAAAVLAMAATHSKKNDFSQILKEMKTDPDPYVQARAQTALDLVQGKRDVIASFLESDDADTRLFTAQYYHYQGTQADLKQVKDAANGESDDAVRAELKDAARAIEKRAEAQKKAAAQKAAPKPVIKKKK